MGDRPFIATIFEVNAQGKLLFSWVAEIEGLETAVEVTGEIASNLN